MTLEMFKGCSMKNKKGEVFNPDFIIYARALKFDMLKHVG